MKYQIARMMKKTTFLSNQTTWLACVLLVLFQFGFTDALLAQSGKTVSGTVLDQDGNPVAGADVFVPPTKLKPTIKAISLSVYRPAKIPS